MCQRSSFSEDCILLYTGRYFENKKIVYRNTEKKTNGTAAGLSRFFIPQDRGQPRKGRSCPDEIRKNLRNRSLHSPKYDITVTDRINDDHPKMIIFCVFRRGN